MPQNIMCTLYAVIWPDRFKFASYEFVITNIFIYETSNIQPKYIDKPGIEQFHLVCTFMILCLFSFWTENSPGTVVNLPLNWLD